MELQTQRLKIVPCTDESISNYATKEFKIGSHINNYLEKLKDDSSLICWGVWLVINKENNKIIGDIGFKGKPDSENTVEVGYGIVPEAQNKGFATEAVNEIIKWAFSSGNVKKIVAECLIDNVSSIKVLEKLNMKRIGIKENMLQWQMIK
ncbi:GNAT family protein [Neobacillus sp. PS2-9]|uniref:GNAT family N-acetyltransferase n=1 Tax=Neobacillus sp. PS2-9 TaxID=3070676 RepID=UPI0027DEE940|nr:GNAT family protein [Neobacillus sp. PS2-9]WML55984.1 GNAT family protein [Neobacillus sp. PS2-9]